jgi:hypothetical protein
MITTSKTTLAPTATYAAAYARLAEIAGRLRGPASAMSIDSLAADVRAAREAHDACRARLSAIRAEIEAEVAAIEADQPLTAAAT